MTRITQSLLHVVAGALILSLLTLAAGRPSLFTDTKAYIVLGGQIAEKVGLARAGQSAVDLAGERIAPAGQASETALQDRVSLGLTVAGSRSPYYSFVLFLLAQAGTFWLVVACGAAVSAWLLSRLAKAASDRPVATYYALVVVGAAATTLPIYIGFMMPDITAGWAVLAALALMLFPREIGRASWWGMVAVALFSVLAHPTHIVVFAATAAVGLAGLAWTGSPVRALGGRVGIIALVAAAGILAPVAYGFAAQLAFKDKLRSPPFLVARLLEDGSGYPYLLDACARDPHAYELCRFKDHPSIKDSQVFLWSKDPVLGIFGPADRETRIRLIDEQGRFVLGAVTAGPWLQLAASVRNVGFLLTRVQIDDATDARVVMEDPDFLVLRRLLPTSRACWTDPKLCESTLPDAALGWLYEVTFLGCLVGGAVLLWRGRGRPEHRRAGLVGAMAVTAVLANAVICGAVSGPYPRYQTRITWVVPASFILIAALLARQGLPAGGNRPARAGIRPRSTPEEGRSPSPALSLAGPPVSKAQHPWS